MFVILCVFWVAVNGILWYKGKDLKDWIPNLQLSALSLKLETRAFNDLIHTWSYKISYYGQSATRLWFHTGVYVSLVGSFLVTIVALIGGGKLICWLFYPETCPAQFVFSPFIPNLELPSSVTFHVVFAVLFSVLWHEIGHGIGSALQGIPVLSMGFIFVVAFPGAFIHLADTSLLSPFSQLQVIAAGPWHNLVQAFTCWILLLMLPSFFFPFYSFGTGPVVTDVPYSSPLYGHIILGERIVAIDNIRMKTANDFSSYLNNMSGPGFCLDEGLLANGTLLPSNTTNTIDLSISSSSSSSSLTSKDTGIPTNNQATSHNLRSLPKSPKLTETLSSNQEQQLDPSSFDGHKEICCPLLNGNCFQILKTNGTEAKNEIFQTEDKENLCLDLQKVIIMSAGRCDNDSPCSLGSQICIAPSTSSGTNILLSLTLLYRQSERPLIYQGNPHALTHAVELFDYYPRGGSIMHKWVLALLPRIPHHTDHILRLMINCALMLALVNLAPIRRFDGELLIKVIYKVCWKAYHRRKRIKSISSLQKSMKQDVDPSSRPISLDPYVQLASTTEVNTNAAVAEFVGNSFSAPGPDISEDEFGGRSRSSTAIFMENTDVLEIKQRERVFKIMMWCSTVVLGIAIMGSFLSVAWTAYHR